MHILSLTLIIKKWHHASINISTVTTIVINFILAFILLQTADWTIANEFEFFNGFPNTLWLYVVIGLLLDLIGAYLVHFVEHKTKFLWRFHLIHHTDTWVTPHLQTGIILVKVLFGLHLPLWEF
jgi:sterol desaturase/sphingolipid hydroxylase (fatty acid hydroxylase superfamily)